jgi:integrase
MEQLSTVATEDALCSQSRLTFSEAARHYIVDGGDARYLAPLMEFLGYRYVDEIDQADIDRAATTICPNVSCDTKNRQVYTPASAVLKFSAARGCCKNFRIKRPCASKKVPNLPSQAHIDAFAHAAGPSLKQIVRFKLETDATEHEILALDWRQVSISRKQAQLTRADGSIRTVSLSPALIEMLARRSKNQVGRVFRSDNGLPYSLRGNHGGRLKTAFNGASKRSGVKMTFLMLHRICRARRTDASGDFESMADG